MKGTREELALSALEIALLRYGGVFSLSEAVRTGEKPKK